MGPRLCRRGNRRRPSVNSHRFPQLQWGHVFVDVEMDDDVPDVVPHPALQWGHVFVDVEISSSLNGCLFVNSDVICEMWQ